MQLRKVVPSFALRTALDEDYALVPDSPLALQPGPVREPPAEWEPRVLVVDDDGVSRLAVAGLLRSLGFVVDLAGGGQEALALSDHWPYAAIFMDCGMPEVDGYMAARTLRRRGASSSRPIVIAVTSHARSVAIASGMDHHMTKPIGADLLRADCQQLGLLARSSPPSEISWPLCIDTPLLDPDRFVQNGLGDRALTAQVTMRFLAEATLRLPEMWRATNLGDATAIQEIALALRREADVVGAARVSALCDRLREAAAGAADSGTVERQLRAALHATAGAVTAYGDAVAFVDESETPSNDPRDGGPDVTNNGDPQVSVRVALADDDPIARIAIKAMLECAQWIELLGDAAGADEAVELAVATHPDVFVLDWIMAGSAGADTVHRILSHCPDTLIIALTASDSLETLAEITAAGAACLVVKGGSGDQLTQTIGRALRASASARAAAKAMHPRRPMLSAGASWISSVGHNGKSTDSSGLNSVDLERLHADFDATGILPELVALFRSETPKRLSDIRGAIDAADAPAVSRHAHQLKGSCLTLAADYSAELCDRLELAAGDGSLDGAAALADQIAEAFAVALALLLREAG